MTIAFKLILHAHFAAIQNSAIFSIVLYNTVRVCVLRLKSERSTADCLPRVPSVLSFIVNCFAVHNAGRVEGPCSGAASESSRDSCIHISAVLEKERGRERERERRKRRKKRKQGDGERKRESRE